MKGELEGEGRKREGEVGNVGCLQMVIRGKGRWYPVTRGFAGTGLSCTDGSEGRKRSEECEFGGGGTHDGRIGIGAFVKKRYVEI